VDGFAASGYGDQKSVKQEDTGEQSQYPIMAEERRGEQEKNDIES
jgi:hypothetical protein